MSIKYDDMNCSQKDIVSLLKNTLKYVNIDGVLSSVKASQL